MTSTINLPPKCRYKYSDTPTLDYVARHGDQAEVRPHVDLENCPGDAQSYDGPHAEQGPAELLDIHRVHVTADGQWHEAGAPHLVVLQNCLEELVEVFLLKAAIILRIVQVPTDKHVHVINSLTGKP
ncbi:uncharacterized protein J3R85_002871 [Psidium guajava]|nr:uncharacterized protein J3R85_002871 [Psidium guajava]